MDEAWLGTIRGLIYVVQFDQDPSEPRHVARCVDAVARDRNRTRTDYLAAIDAALASERDLSRLIPQPHADAVLRRYLAAVADEIRNRQAR